MKLTWRKCLMPALALITAGMLMGVEECNADDVETTLNEVMTNEVEPPKGAISVHEIIKYPHADDSEQKIPSYFGTDITIRKLPLLYYKEILSVTAVPRTNDVGFFDLKLKLSVRGRKMWIGLSVPNQRNHLAFVIDGMYYRSFRPRMLYDESDEVIIDGPFDQATAMELQTNGVKNHKKANR